MERVLIIAAHPDDEVLGCGGVISKYGRQGVEFMVLFIAEGSSCRYSSPGSTESIIAISQRTEQSINALNILQVRNYHFNNFPCGRLDQVPILEVNKVIEKSLNDFCPDTVFTHSCVDANNDHRIVNRATIMATRPVPGNTVKHLLSYEVNSSTEWNFSEVFKPNIFEQIEERDLNLKCKALNAYETELKAYPFPRSDKAIETLASMRGLQSGVSFAEAFSLIRGYSL